MGLRMKKYFRIKSRRKKFEEILNTWIGTPYHHMWHTKHRGADCSLFIAECLIELGILKKINKVSCYPCDWHINSDMNLLEETVQTAKLIDNLQLVEVKDLYFGDTMLFSFVSTNIPHHSAVYCGHNTIVQAGKGGVAKTLLDNRWRKHLIKTYRIIEK